MGKVLIFISLIILVTMTIGASITPLNPFFILASVNPTYQYIREILAVVLALQFVTRPPRHVWFRLLAAGIASIIIVWSIQQTNSYHMQFFDTLSILGASIAILVTALERKAVKMRINNYSKA